MNALDWKFEYPFCIDSEQPCQWIVQDFTRVIDDFIYNERMLEIVNILLRRSDHMHVEKIDGEYKLLIGCDFTEDAESPYYRCFAYDRLNLLHEIISFKLKDIHIFNCLWSYVVPDNMEADAPIDLSKSQTLSDILNFNSNFEEFKIAWNKFNLILRNRNPGDRETIFSRENIMAHLHRPVSTLVYEDRVVNTVSATLIIIKPNSVRQCLEKPILDDFLEAGYTILSSKYILPTIEQAELHYSDHIGMSWFEKITKALSSGRIYVAIIGRDENTVDDVRKFIGCTDPKQAEYSTIRGRYGTSVDDNVIHASDSHESYLRERAVWFN